MPDLIDHTYLISVRMRNFSFDEMTKFSKGASDKKSPPVAIKAKTSSSEFASFPEYDDGTRNLARMFRT